MDTSNQAIQNEKVTQHRSRVWVWLLILAAAVAGVWLIRSRQTHAQAPGGAGGRAGRGAMVVPVSAAPATRGDIAVYLDGLGSVTPFYTVNVHSRVDGQLMSVHFEEGQLVNAGDVLLEIDPRPFQAALDPEHVRMGLQAEVITRLLRLPTPDIAAAATAPSASQPAEAPGSNV